MSAARPSPAHQLLKLAARVRSRGVREVLGLGLQRSRDFIASSEELIVLAREAGGDRPERADVTVEHATASDGPRYARNVGTDSASTFAARLTATSHCFLVCEGDKVLHASWVETHSAWTRELRGHLNVPLGDCYVYESFTHADTRGRGIYPHALKGICAWAGAEGLRRVWVAVEASNPASLRAVAKGGFEPELTISFRRNVGRLEVSGGTCDDDREVLCLTRRG